ncbi:MAG: lactonase family protein, partial [Verrucomicrobiota bacterium]
THLAVDKDGKNVLVANYGSGSVAVFPIGPDGAMRTVSARIQHHGSSVDAARQEGPHAHSILPDPASRFALTCDLGLDQVLIYKFNPANGSLAANNPAFASVKPGAGPRHFVFAPGGKSLYVINELDSTMTGFAYDSKRGALREFQTLSTLPRDFRGKSFAAEVAVHPSGKFLYGSNRGHDSIAVFGLEKKTGRLSLVEHQSTGGKTPRHFEIDPAGKFLLAANQDSGTIASFRIDAKTGKLLPLGVVIETEGPECVKFLPAD